MRLLRIVRSVDPRSGGPVETLYQVAKELQREGHTVEIATLDHPEAPWVREFGLPVTALGSRPHGYGFTPRLVPWLREKASGVDAVVVSGLWQYQTFGTWRALRGSKVPYYVFPHGMLDPWFKRAYPLKHLKKWLYWPWAEHRALRDARAVFFTCEEERLLARKSFWLYRCREAVVNYGTAEPSGDPVAQQRTFQNAFQELKGRRFILYLGRIHEKKGCDLLLRAFAQLRRHNPGLFRGPQELRLVMAGPGAEPYIAELKRLTEVLDIAPLVHWPGMLRGDLKWGAFRSAEAFILPSHQENFGVAVAEALACALPVLLSNRVNIWREVLRMGGGLVADDSETGTFSLLSRWMALEPQERRRFREKAAQCFKAQFTVRQAASSLVKEVCAR
ncbi:MAG: glycosyltransferase [Verrucomicrobia bacterium]|nr:glycosyltransferase [Verrucomicrobiota bacterium]MBI3870633.1 glycosyltransferase [Verrucomicrobiota bacterium]